MIDNGSNDSIPYPLVAGPPEHTSSRAFIYPIFVIYYQSGAQTKEVSPNIRAQNAVLSVTL